MGFIGSAIPRPVAGDKAKARHITDIHDVLSGVTGFGQPMLFTNLDSPTYPALAVRQINSSGPIFYVWDGSESTGKILDVQRQQIVMNQPINATGIGSKATGFNALGLSGTFNNVADIYRGIFLNLTNTASHADSACEEFIVGGTSKWKVNMAGKLVTGEVDGSLITDGSLTGDKFGAGGIPHEALGLGIIKDENVAADAAISYTKLSGVPSHAHTGTGGDGGALGFVGESHIEMGGVGAVFAVDPLKSATRSFTYTAAKWGTGTFTFVARGYKGSDATNIIAYLTDNLSNNVATLTFSGSEETRSSSVTLVDGRTYTVTVNANGGDQYGEISWSKLVFVRSS